MNTESTINSQNAAPNCIHPESERTPLALGRGYLCETCKTIVRDHVEETSGPKRVAEESTALAHVGNGFPPAKGWRKPTELDDEQLAKLVSDGAVKLALDSERVMPYYMELRQRFHKKAEGMLIHGCKTWNEYCQKILQRTRRAINYWLAGGNPASKRKSQGSGTEQQSTGETPEPENAKPLFAIKNSPIDGDPMWAKQEVSRRILEWSDSYLRDFPPPAKREIAEDVIASLRDAMEFEAPQPTSITGDAVPEPDPGTLEELRQRILRMADVRDIEGALEQHVTELLQPLLMRHPYGPFHTVRVSVRRKDSGRIAVNDWVECTSVGKRLEKLIGKPGLGRVVGMDQLQRRPKIRWHDGHKWMKPYSFFATDGSVRVLFDWQAAERHPVAFNTYISDKNRKRGA